ncbi:fused D-ribose transporter subunits of ABC superfamily: ATP-binding components [uncultured spirochete]|uniref:Fused D-ribose transporter subunits of ABC superfamily: ATP-binding components n=1 Tax=uncultured spirochete TaxID=156406 RepID=A0A3P3XUU0_9SPIR|nr:fused D-ribose transporter subunits of ABC superfamily: ATP-binding components [uncultured spirochete]
MDDRVLWMKGISKSFPGVQALKAVDFDLERGEVHALVGENGAGKSTLMKILSGLYKADEGEIWLRGRKLSSRGIKAMIDAGVSVIYQELNLMRQLSVAENIFIGREPMRHSGLIDWKKMYLDVQRILEPFNVDINPKTKIYLLSPAYQQVVEIAKALSLNSDILVMDEPTASLTGNEVDKLFEIIRNLRNSGVSIIYISHRLEEIPQIADRVTVLRDGEKILTKPLGELTTAEIIRHMVGRTLTEQYPKISVPLGKEILHVENLTKKGYCEDVSFSVRSGEIVGFTGLVGAGRTEIMQTIYGRMKKDSGRIYIDGKEVQIHNTCDAVRKGIGLIPEERKRQGLVLGLSVFDNVVMTILDKESVLGFLKKKKLNIHVEKLVELMEIKTPSTKQLVRYLSGGNQQNIILAKWFLRHCKVYIFDEPTRGIDVGAKVEIYKLMQNLAKEGAGVIMVSSELPEILNMSDRIEVVFSGSIVKEFQREEADSEKVMEYALGLHEHESQQKLRAAGAET